MPVAGRSGLAAPVIYTAGEPKSYQIGGEMRPANTNTAMEIRC